MYIPRQWMTFDKKKNLGDLIWLTALGMLPESEVKYYIPFCNNSRL